MPRRAAAAAATPPARRGRAQADAASAAASAAKATAAVASLLEAEAATAALRRQRDATAAALAALENRLGAAETNLEAARTAARAAARRAGGTAALAPTLTFQSVPPDCLLLVAERLPMEGRLALASTCASFRETLVAEPEILAWRDVFVDRSKLMTTGGAALPAMQGLRARGGSIRRLTVQGLKLLREFELFRQTVPAFTRLQAFTLATPLQANESGCRALFSAIGRSCPALVAVHVERAASVPAEHRGRWGRPQEIREHWMFRAEALASLGPAALGRLTSLKTLGSLSSTTVAFATSLRELGYVSVPPDLPPAMTGLTRLEVMGARTFDARDGALRPLASVVEAALSAFDAAAVDCIARLATALTRLDVTFRNAATVASIPGRLAALRGLRTLKLAPNADYWNAGGRAAALALDPIARLAALTSLHVVAPLPLAAPVGAEMLGLVDVVLTGIQTTPFAFPPVGAMPNLARLVLVAAAAGRGRSNPVAINLAPLARAQAPSLQTLVLVGRLTLTATTANPDDAAGDAAARGAAAALATARDDLARAQAEYSRASGNERNASHQLYIAERELQRVGQGGRPVDLVAHALVRGLPLRAAGPPVDPAALAAARAAHENAQRVARAALNEQHAASAAVQRASHAHDAAERSVEAAMSAVMVRALPAALPSLASLHLHCAVGGPGHALHEALKRAARRVKGGSVGACASCGAWE